MDNPLFIWRMLERRAQVKLNPSVPEDLMWLEGQGQAEFGWKNPLSLNQRLSVNLNLIVQRLIVFVKLKLLGDIDREVMQDCVHHLDKT